MGERGNERGGNAVNWAYTDYSYVASLLAVSLHVSITLIKHQINVNVIYERYGLCESFLFINEWHFSST